MTLEAFNPGEYVMHMGDRGDKWYIVLQGCLNVFVPNFQLNDLMKKSNTVAVTECEQAREKLMAQYRKDLGIGSRKSSLPETKLASDKAATIKQRRTAVYFELLDYLAHAGTPPPSFSEDSDIPHMYNEELNAFVPENKDADSEWWTSVFQFKDRMAFGDVALVQDVPRTATIRCEERTLLLVVSKDDYQVIKEGGAMKQALERQNFIRGMYVFRQLSDPWLMYIASLLCEKKLNRGEEVCVEGQPLLEVSIIRTGECKVTGLRGGRDDSSARLPTARRQLPLAILAPPSIIADADALCGRTQHSVTVLASTRLELYCMSRQHFLGLPQESALELVQSIAKQQTVLRNQRQRYLDDHLNNLPLPPPPDRPSSG
eukprot:gene6583-7883_t